MKVFYLITESKKSERIWSNTMFIYRSTITKTSFKTHTAIFLRIHTKEDASSTNVTINE